MKKIMPNVAAVGLGLFALAVFAIVISLSYKALGLIFPNDLFDQLIGLVLFDASALLWFAVFVYLSRSTAQYVFSSFGFLIGLGGTIGLVGIEVGLSSGLLELEAMRRPLTYIFIGVAVSHLILLYARHASSPEVNNEISMGVDLAKVVDEGQKQAEQHIKNQMPQLGAVIASRLIEDAMQRLNIRPQIIDARALPVDDDLNISTNGYPVQVKAKTPGAAAANFLEGVFPWIKPEKKEREYEMATSTPAQRSVDVGASSSPTAEQHYHPMSEPIRAEEKKEREIVREPLLEIFRGEPIFFDSAIATNGPGVNVKIGDALQAILCEDGKYNISSINEVYAFARITEEDLNYWRTGKDEEATQTGADFREGA